MRSTKAATSMLRVDLIYAADCPNVALARGNLRLALKQLGLQLRWNEHVIGTATAPRHVRGYGSPTLLIDGQDVAGLVPTGEASCRIYASPEGRAGAPSVAQITVAVRDRLIATQKTGSCGPWGSAACAAPAVGTALLPALACPACWPAYAGVLSSLGLGFWIEARWLFVLTAGALALSLGVLAFRSSRRRGYGPFLVGLMATVTILISKFLVASKPSLYAGLGALVAASVWNAWPKGAKAVHTQASRRSLLQKGPS
jgi:mercuric ion transport protein